MLNILGNSARGYRISGGTKFPVTPEFTVGKLATMLVARSGRVTVMDRQTDRRTDGLNDRPSTVTLAAHARRGLLTHFVWLDIVAI